MVDTAQRLMMCVEIGKAVLSTLERSTMVATLIQRLSDLIPARNWTLFLLDEARQAGEDLAPGREAAVSHKLQGSEIETPNSSQVGLGWIGEIVH